MTKVVTIGLGYIGLPTSALIASKGIKVNGVDINNDIVNTINSGRIHIVEPDLENIVKDSVNKKMLFASTKPETGDVYLIVVPTPFKENKKPDISYVESATKSIIPLLKKGDLYIIESTSPVGTTEKMRDLIFSERPELENEIFIAYCPERVLPGNIIYELVNNDRVIGGIDERSTKKSVKFYSRFVNGNLHSTNSRTAEMCKLVENSSRDVQIAFANELSIICDKANINVWELINLANKHPRVNILNPGCGVGGHCIAVDPYFITSKFPNESKIISTARKINNFKADWVYNKVISSINKFKVEKKYEPVLGIFGITFKPNIDDLRESPALQITKQIIESYKMNLVNVIEPNINNFNNMNIISLENGIKNSDIFIFLVSHDEFKSISKDIVSNKVCLNFCGLTINE